MATKETCLEWTIGSSRSIKMHAPLESRRASLLLIVDKPLDMKTGSAGQACARLLTSRGWKSDGDMMGVACLGMQHLSAGVS